MQQEEHNLCHNLHHTRYILKVLNLVCNGSGDEVPGRYKWGSMVNKWHWDRFPPLSAPVIWFSCEYYSNSTPYLVDCHLRCKHEVVSLTN